MQSTLYTKFFNNFAFYKSNYISILGFGLLVFVFFISLNSPVFAQAKANANVYASIVKPLSITKTSDLHFGNIAVVGNDGKVVLSPAGTRIASGGAVLPSEEGALAVATFKVMGESSFIYNIILPEGDLLITHVNGTDNMIVNNFKSLPALNGQLTSGMQTISVGATLNVNAHQELGFYEGGSFEVSINYN